MLMAPSEVDGLMAEGLVAEGPPGAPCGISRTDGPAVRPYHERANRRIFCKTVRIFSRVWKYADQRGEASAHPTS